MSQALSAVKALSTISYFGALDARSLEEVARSAVRREYEAHEMVFLEGEPCAGLFVVELGWLKAFKTSSAGREQVIRFVGPGDAFNEVGVLAASPNLVSVVALEPTVVWVVPPEILFRLIDENPRLARLVISNLAKRTQHLIGLVEDLSLRSVESRLARLLLQESKEGEVQRQRWTTQAELAARLGTV